MLGAKLQSFLRCLYGAPLVQAQGWALLSCWVSAAWVCLPDHTACPWPRTHTCRVNKHQDDALRDTSPISADSGYCPASWAPWQERGSWPHPLLPVQVGSQPSSLPATLQKTKLSFAVSG